MAKRKKIHYGQRAFIFIVLALIFASMFLFESQIYEAINHNSQTGFSQISQSDLLVHYIDVGQGDAIFVQLPDGRNMLIDSGPGSSSDELINYINSYIFSDVQGVIDYFIITHPHEDHIGGSDEVFENYQVNNFYRPQVFTPEEIDEFEIEFGAIYADSLFEYDTNIFETMVNFADDEPNNNEIVFSHIDIPLLIEGSNYNINFYSPIQVQIENLNNFSPMIVLEYENKKFLFTGDAETDVEEDFIGTFADFSDIDVLKVGHHGSTTSTSQEFLDATTPDIAIISVGRDNRYHHPADSVIDRLVENNIETYRTDLSGNILVGVNEGEIVVYQTLAGTLPIVVEVWQVYLTVVFALFIAIMQINPKKIKLR